jgi:hypothetical protein
VVVALLLQHIHLLFLVLLLMELLDKQELVVVAAAITILKMDMEQVTVVQVL